VLQDWGPHRALPHEPRLRSPVHHRKPQSCYGFNAALAQLRHWNRGVENEPPKHPDTLWGLANRVILTSTRGEARAAQDKSTRRRRPPPRPPLILPSPRRTCGVALITSAGALELYVASPTRPSRAPFFPTTSPILLLLLVLHLLLLFLLVLLLIFLGGVGRVGGTDRVARPLFSPVPLPVRDALPVQSACMRGSTNRRVPVCLPNLSQAPNRPAIGGLGPRALQCSRSPSYEHVWRFAAFACMEIRVCLANFQ